MKTENNPRGAGRKSKYEGATKTVTFRIPEKEEEKVKTLVRDYLKNIVIIPAKPEPINVDVGFEPLKEKIIRQPVDRSKLVAGIVYTKDGCGCYLEEGILRKLKDSKCKKTKPEHNF